MFSLWTRYGRAVSEAQTKGFEVTFGPRNVKHASNYGPSSGLRSRVQ